MRRLPVVICAAALALAACSGDDPAIPRPSWTRPTPPTPTPASATTPSSTGSTTTVTGSPGPSPQPDLQLPRGMPSVVDDPAEVGAIAAGDLTPLVPRGSTPTSSVLTAPGDAIDQVAVAWQGGGPPPGRAGLAVWQWAGAAWTAIYAFTDPRGEGVFGIRMDQGDLTDDGIADLLTFEDVGGSGACGTYRVIASTDGDAAQILRREVCDTEIQIAGGDLRVREAVFGATDPHCCPSAFRTTILRWNEPGWDRVSSEVSPAPASD